MAITFLKADKVILITLPQTLVLLQDLVNAIRTFEALPENMDIPSLANASGKEDLGGGLYVGITLELLDNWRIQFEARPGPTYVQCRVSGGNPVTTNIYGDEPIKPSAYTWVTRALSTSASLLSGSGGGITQQEVRDAAALALSPGVIPATGSLDKKIDDIQTVVGTSNTDVAIIKQVLTGRWKIVGNQMIFYASNGTTPLFTFNLFDASGSPTMTDVYDRQRV